MRYALPKPERLWLLSIAGLSFWFFLTFPFANHNESFAWLGRLERAGLGDVLGRPMPPVVTFRPLGVALAWLAYRLSGGSIYPIEALNYALAAAAWLLLLAAVPERRVLALVALIAQGAFFSGYIYLFHLHGVFYSPLLLQIAVLFHAHRSPRPARALLATSLLAVVLALVHPFALLLQLGFVAGRGAERRLPWMTVGIAAAPVAGLLALIASGPGGGGSVAALLVSYRMTEVNALVSAAALGLTVLSILGAPRPPRMRAALLIVAGGAALGFVLLRIPLVLLWIAGSLVAAAAARRWAIAGMLAAAACLPIVSGTGSPTYAVFAIMIAAAATALGAGALEARLGALRAPPALALGLIPLLAFVLRLGPIAPRAVAPLLAEKEKTFQMEAVLDWLARSEYAGCGLALAQRARSPSAADNAVRRERRPPTQQEHLDAYLAARERRACPSGDTRPVVAFGGESLDEGRRLHVVPGRWAGDAIVYLPPREPAL